MSHCRSTMRTVLGGMGKGGRDGGREIGVKERERRERGQK